MRKKKEKLPPLPPSVSAKVIRREEEIYEKRIRGGHFFFSPGGLSVSVGPGLGGGGGNALRTAVAIDEDVVPYPHPVGVNGGSGLIRPQRGV